MSQIKFDEKTILDRRKEDNVALAQLKEKEDILEDQMNEMTLHSMGSRKDFYLMFLEWFNVFLE